MAWQCNVSDQQVAEIMDQLDIKGDLQVDLIYQANGSLKVVKQGENASITYGTRAELFRGLGLLAQHSGEENYAAEQKARFALNGAMLDCSRNGVVNLNAAKQMVRYLALMGHNMLMLYTEDTYEVPEYPYFGYMRGRYTQKELQELDAYAKGYGVELIPCMQTLAHLATTLRWDCFQNIKDTDDILLCGEEKTYEFIEAMIRACRNSYTTNRIHIGMDEAFMMGFGQYRVKNGIQNREEIFCKHLNRVAEICRKYGFKPMIWSDMFYRLAFGGSYDAAGDISEEVRKLVPPDVELVYWEYDRFEKDSYIAPLKSHKQFDNPILFAGGSYRWLSYAPHTVKSLEASRAALSACKETGIREVFCTAWGDQGNETPVFAILPALQLFAELSYQEEVSDEELANRLYACTGEYLSDLLMMDDPDMPDGKFHRVITNPSAYLLYSDVLGSLYEKHCDPCYKEFYANYAKNLFAASERSKNHGYMYDLLAKLCSVLELKSCISAESYAAYQAGDREALRMIAEQTLPEITERLETFRAAVEVRWLTEYKVSGYDVLDFRIGGISARIQNAIRRISAYLNGEISKIEELEGERLSFNCLTEAELQKDPVLCWNIRAHQYSANNI